MVGVDLFLSTAFGFPTVLFTPLLIVATLYWLLVALGTADTELLDSSGEAGEALGFSAVMARVGLGRVPATVAITLLVLVAWFVSMLGSIMVSVLDLESTALLLLLGLVVLLIAIVGAWAVASGVVMGLARFLPGRAKSAEHELVGRTCTIRIGRADAEFGQAEITTQDGASISIPVRTTGGEILDLGSTALIFEHDARNEVFLVTRFDPALDPGRD